jgi:beta-phosphoglucomutase
MVEHGTNPVDEQTGSPFPFCVRNGFRALIFDWDGVLVDSGADYYRAYELTLQEVGLKTTPREIFLREGMTTEQVMAALFAERGIGVSEEKIRELVQRRREWYSRLARHRFFPGVWDLVQKLRGAGHKLGLVTGSSRQTVALALPPEREQCFDVVVTAESISRPKPHPEPFLVATESLGVSPEHCLVAENAPFGIQSAHRAGCRVVAVCTTLLREDLGEADWIVADHRELELLLVS